MQSVGTGIQKLLAEIDPDLAKGLRIAQNNACFKAAVRRAWSDNAGGAEYLLAHVNGIFISEDKRPRTGPDKDLRRMVLGVYLDDSMARSELDARREWFLIAAAAEGIHVDEVRILPAQRGMKERRLFPESVERAAELLGKKAARAQAGRGRSKKEPSDVLAYDQAKLLEILKRAFCLSFEDFEQAAAVLERIEGAALCELSFSARRRRARARYRCHFYVDEADREAMAEVLEAYGDAVISSAKRLGLAVTSFQVHESPTPLKGRRAFPRQGAPLALASFGVQEADTESARVAEKVRRLARRSR